MVFAKHDYVIQTLPADRTEQSFHERILPRAPRHRNHFLDLHSHDSQPKVFAVNLVTIAQQEARSGLLRESLNDLLRRSGSRRMLGYVEVQLSIDRWSPGAFPPRQSGPETLKTLPLPADDGLWLDDKESRAPLAPNLRKPNPEEAISWTKLRSWIAALIYGQLMAEGEILQGQVATKFEDGNECRDEGK